MRAFVMTATSKSLERFLLAFCAILALVVFAASLRFAVRYPGIDLRSKVVGARLLAAHRDAYPSPEAPAQNEYFRMFSADTYTPALLTAYLPLSPLPYRMQRYFYFSLDWLCIAWLFLQTRSWFDAKHRMFHAAAFVLLLILDPGMWLHLERGQYYLELAALMVIVLARCCKAGNGQQGTGRASTGHASWVSAVVLAILILVRPTFGILLPILWVQRLRTLTLRALLAAAALLAVLVPAWGVQPWSGYLRTVSAIQQKTVNAIFHPSAANAEAAGIQKTKFAEGEDFSKSQVTNYAISRTFLRVVALKGVQPVAVKLFRTARTLAAVNTALLLAAASYCILLAFRLRCQSTLVKMGFALLAPTVIETFGPQRNAYCDVTLVPIAILLLALVMRSGSPAGRHRRWLVVAACMCIFAAVGALILPPLGRLIEVVSLARWLVLLLLVNASFMRIARNAGQQEVTPAT